MQYYQKTVQLLPRPYSEAYQRVECTLQRQITEIRLYSGCEPMLTFRSKLVSLAGLCGRTQSVISHGELQQIFLHLNRYSAFSQENRLRQGYFTLQGGQRVGIAAQAVWREDRLLQPENISSMNIRIARDLALSQPERWKMLVQKTNGILICGAPGSGKTTVLRGIARLISEMGQRCAVMDERGELFPLGTEGFLFAKPPTCNVLTDYPKSVAMLQAVRVLSPQVLICDEISGENVEPLSESMNTGVRFIATLHADSMQQLQAKSQYRSLRELQAVDTLVFLSDRHPGEIREVVYVAG